MRVDIAAAWKALAVTGLLALGVPTPALGAADTATAAMEQAAQPDALTRARIAYNDRLFDQAITAAEEAMRTPASANAAAVVLGRALLERYRQSADQSPDSTDLDRARAVLARVRPAELAPRDHVEFLLGLGVSLFVDGCTGGCFSAAAEFFQLALARVTSPETGSREAIFEWWAGALDRQAQLAPDEERERIDRRMLERADAELAARPDSASASYWVAAAARGAGDFERAWGAAIAAWVRARYLGPSGDTLRTDLDRLVTQVLLPERAKHLSPGADARPMLALLLRQWTEIKGKYRDKGKGQRAKVREVKDAKGTMRPSSQGARTVRPDLFPSFLCPPLALCLLPFALG